MDFGINDLEDLYCVILAKLESHFSGVGTSYFLTSGPGIYFTLY